LGIENQIPVALATPSIITKYGRPLQFTDTLVIGISQSGQSPDIRSVLMNAKHQGCPTISITNEVQSPLEDIADFTIELHAGPERAVAATKTYTASLLTVALLSAAINNDHNRLDFLAKASELIAETIRITNENLSRFARYCFMENCAVLGRGYNYATAFEISLKIKELTRILAMPYSTADFRHGPIAMITGGFPVFLIAPSGKVSREIQEMARSVNELGGEVVAIGNDPIVQQESKLSVPIPAECPEWFSPVVSVIPGQMLAVELAIQRGLDPDYPAGLSKVTKTL
jgi:glucosamine--fructose-6-phosphate aminotransferase (isomerizing)